MLFFDMLSAYHKARFSLRRTAELIVSTFVFIIQRMSSVTGLSTPRQREERDDVYAAVDDAVGSEKRKERERGKR